MAQSKKNKSSIFQKMVDTPFIDFDSCAFCNSHNGPFVWVRFDSAHQFLCEECYESYNEMKERIKKKLHEEPLG